MTNPLVVIEDNDPIYSDPIQVKRGDLLIVGEEDSEYPGWIWCENGQRKSGWVPDDCIETDATGSRAKYDYSAVELRARVGERVFPIETKSGWVLCSNSDGDKGWLPLTKVREE
jgi:variant SH3 domain-containing protein